MAGEISGDLIFISPLISLVIGALLILLYEVFIHKAWSRGAFTTVVLLTAFAINVYLLANNFYPETGTAFYGQLFIDAFSGYVNAFIILIAALAVLASVGHLGFEKVESVGEYYSLVLMSTIGAIVFNSASEFITMFVGLEIMSMAIYCLCGAALSRRESAESAVKYFLLGSFSSAFMLYGIALLYGLTGTTELMGTAVQLASVDSGLAMVAIGLVLVGLFFKIAAVPFHFWAPDVYQGAPTPITIYMASVIKASAVIVIMRVLWIAFPESLPVWTGAIWTIAVITMTLGNLTALRQRSLKRMLAYSSVAHAGYMMVALLVSDLGGAAAIVYYLIAYSAMTIGSFAVVMAVAAPYADSTHPDDISRFNDLAARQPILAALMALFLLSLAGIPPGMAGLLGKFFVFNSAVKGGFVGIAIIGVINSAISAYYYLRVIVSMYFIEQRKEDSYSKSVVGAPMGFVLAVCAAAVIYVGVFPARFYDGAAAVIDPIFGAQNQQAAVSNESSTN